MRVTARVDYAVRAARELGLAHPDTLTAEAIAERQAPAAGVHQADPGPHAAGRGRGRAARRRGRLPARVPARAQVSVADIVRAVEGPLADVRGEPPEDLDYPGDGEVLRRLWIATRASLRSVLEQVTLADLAAGELPDPVDGLTTSRAPGTAADRAAAALSPNWVRDGLPTNQIGPQRRSGTRVTGWRGRQYGHRDADRARHQGLDLGARAPVPRVRVRRLDRCRPSGCATSSAPTPPRGGRSCPGHGRS